jgi:hypothetical protein
LDGSGVALEKIHIKAGSLAAQADYRYEPGAVRPHRVRISLSTLDAAELEQLVMPTLKRSRGLIARALGFGRTPVPEWLRDRQVEGSLSVSSLHLAEIEVKKLRSTLIWNGTSVALDDIAGSLDNGAISGRIFADLRGSEPVYRLAGKAKSVEWNGGIFDAEVSLNTSGTGDALVANLQSEGSFTGQSFADQPLEQFDSVSGCYLLEWARPLPHLRFTELQMAAGGELFLGRGAMQDDGRVVIQVSSGSRQLSMSGTLVQLRLDDAAGQ